MELTAYEKKVLSEQDGHFCYDWDGLTVSALTPEYGCCVCYPKSWQGRVLNWLFMLWWNLSARIVCGRKGRV